MSIHQRLNKIAIKLNKNQTQLAKELNVSRNAVVRVTKENKLPGIKLLKPLADMGVNINWLLTGKGTMLLDNNVASEPTPQYLTTQDGPATSFQDVIKQFYESSEDYKEAWKKLLLEKDKRLEEKDEHLREKERIIQIKDKMIQLLEKAQNPK